jgi:ABC-type ATPase with predicted acetyltransferase domain
MNHRIFFILLFATVAVTGCHSMHTITRADLDAKYRESYTRSFLAVIFYRGSADGFDYFVVRNVAQRDYYCRIPSPATELPPMPLSHIEEKWVQFDIEKPLRERLGKDAEFFRLLEANKHILEGKKSP